MGSNILHVLSMVSLSPQVKEELKDFRAKIAGGENIRDALKDLDRRGRGKGKSAVAEMLQMKHQGDGQTLLMYAARYWTHEQFWDLFDEMSSRVSTSVGFTIGASLLHSAIYAFGEMLRK